MVGLRTRSDVAAQIQPAQPWRMPIHREPARRNPARLAQLDHAQHAGVAGQHAQIIHDFTDGGDPRIAGEGQQLLGNERSAVALILAGGHTRRQREKQAHGHAIGGVKHPADTWDTGDIGDLMGIADASGGAMWRQRPREFTGSQQGALNVGVRLHQARREIVAAQIDLARSSVRAAWPDARDASAVHGDVSRVDFVGKHVYDPAVAQHQVRRALPTCHLNQLAPLVLRR